MTDNEIIKAWQKLVSTGDAPVGEHWSCGGVVTTKLAKETLDMLNRQKSQIEGLQDEVVIKTDMLNEQKAEIERYLHSIKLLEKDVQKANSEIKRLKFRKCLYSGLYSEYDIKLIRDCTQGECFHRESEEAVRLEAIKEFAERLTDRICENINRSLDNPNGNNYYLIDVYKDIDNLVKEMVGDDNG